MMALVSELSMNQAEAMKLQQEVKGKEQELEQSYVRMERGEAPNEEAEREWLRMVRDEARREKELIERKEVYYSNIKNNIIEESWINELIVSALLKEK